MDKAFYYSEVINIFIKIVVFKSNKKFFQQFIELLFKCKSNCQHLKPGLQQGCPPWGIFLNDYNPCLYEVYEKTAGNSERLQIDKRNQRLKPTFTSHLPEFKPRSRLSTQPFGVFRGFLRNTHKYKLGSLRKTPPRRAFHQQAQVPSETIGLNTTNNNFLSKFYRKWAYDSQNVMLSTLEWFKSQISNIPC